MLAGSSTSASPVNQADRAPLHGIDISEVSKDLESIIGIFPVKIIDEDFGRSDILPDEFGNKVFIDKKDLFFWEHNHAIRVIWSQ